MVTEQYFIVITSFIFLTLLSYISIWVLLKSPLLHFFTDKPGVRKVHQNSTPRAGGVCIALVFIVILFFWHSFTSKTIPILDIKMFQSMLFITIGILFVGLLDDTTFISINNKYKFLYELVFISVIVALFPFNVNTITILPNLSLNIGWMGFPLSVLWIVGVANALNIIDGIDGLAGSTAFIGFLSIGVLAGISGHFNIVLLCVVLVALNSGFLFHNISPARIFLGDTGSLLFGMILGFLTLYIITIPEKNFSILIAPLLVGFPILDVFIAILRRYLKAFFKEKKVFKSFNSILKADNEHIHHRLMYKGLNHTNTCFILILFSIIFSTSALIISFVETREMVKVMVLIFVYLCVMVLWFLVKLNFSDRIIWYTNRIISSFKKSSYNKENSKVSICIINADEVLRHSLKQCNQNYFSFSFLQPNNFPFSNNPFSVVIINNICPENIENDKKLYKEILNYKYDCHVIIIADNEIINKNDNSIIFKGKPLYIPQLLVDIYPFALNYHNVYAFENAFIGAAQENQEEIVHKEILQQRDPVFVK